MTGAKGTQFAVTYIEKFNQMEEQLKSQTPVTSYMIDNPIERAKAWIEEQQQKMLLETKVEEQVAVINHKQDVIKELTREITIAEKRQILNKAVRAGCFNVTLINNRWTFLYDQFEMKYHINIRVCRGNYVARTNLS